MNWLRNWLLNHLKKSLILFWLLLSQEIVRITSPLNITDKEIKNSMIYGFANQMRFTINVNKYLIKKSFLLTTEHIVYNFEF